MERIECIRLIELELSDQSVQMLSGRQTTSTDRLPVKHIRLCLISRVTFIAPQR